MPRLIGDLFQSARRLRRKQHIWQTDTGFGRGLVTADLLTKITPFRGMKIVVFSFTVPGLTEYATTKSGRKVGPIPHHEIIAFHNVEFLPVGQEPPEEEKQDYFFIEYQKDIYWIKKIDLRKNKVTVRCDCFTGDTQVVLADGSYETLENLVGKENVSVISFNEQKGKFEETNMLKCEMKNPDSEILKIILDNGKEIKTTPNHLFLTKKDGWVKASDLFVGQSLETLTDKDTVLERDTKDSLYSVVVFVSKEQKGQFEIEGAVIDFKPINVLVVESSKTESYSSDFGVVSNPMSFLTACKTAKRLAEKHGLDFQNPHEFSVSENALDCAGNTSCHEVSSIETLSNAPVYCMTVEGLGNFVLATPDENSGLISGVVVKNCSDFFYTWAWSDFKVGCLWGRPPKKYIRKTPPPPEGRPYRNPNNYPGFCKHIYYIWRNLFEPKNEGSKYFSL